MSMGAHKMRTTYLRRLLPSELSTGGSFPAGSLCCVLACIVHIGRTALHRGKPRSVLQVLEATFHFQLVKCYLKAMSCSYC